MKGNKPVISKSKKNYSNGIPARYRERFTDTTLGKFKERIEEILAKIDKVHDAETPVRQLEERIHWEDAIACWTGKYYIHFTVTRERRSR